MRMPGINRERLMRPRNGGHQPVTSIELFFDLVFVFAITQLSHLLIDHLNPAGAFQTVILLMAVWVAWMYTTWMTNQFDPDRIPVRLLLIGVMLISLIMSSAIPHAFTDRALMFAVSYVAIQVGRPLVILLMIGKDSSLSTTFQGIVSWAGSAGVLWILGSQAEGTARTGIWVVALLIELTGPFVGYRFPGIGRSTTTDWNVEGHHIAERCQLFLILAFGESILVTGLTFGNLGPDVITIVAFATAFIGSVALWWIYFHRGADLGAEAIASSDDPGRFARSVYSYAFVLLIAGVITIAVADELVIAHPRGDVDTPTIWVLLGGTALYLLGNALIVWMLTHRIAGSLLVAVVALGLLGLVASRFTPLGLSMACAAIALATAAWEVIGFRPSPATGQEAMSET
jgi:low temperature requirement protein LtrA